MTTCSPSDLNRDRNRQVLSPPSRHRSTLTFRRVSPSNLSRRKRQLQIARTTWPALQILWALAALASAAPGGIEVEAWVSRAELHTAPGLFGFYSRYSKWEALELVLQQSGSSGKTRWNRYVGCSR